MGQQLYELPNGWEWTGFLDAVSTSGFKVGKIPKKDFRKEGSLPIIDQSQNYIAGYCESDEGFNGKLPVIVYGDHTNSVKHIDFQFICGADGTKVLAPKEGVYSWYLFYAISQFRPDSQGYRRHFPILKQKHIPLPPLDEQKRIVAKLDALFTRIDAAITHLQETLELSKALFASALGSIMSEIVATYGERTVGDFASHLKTGKTPPTKEKQYYDSSNIDWFAPADFGRHKVVKDSKKKLAQKAVSDGKATVFESGTILLVAIGATIGKVGLLVESGSANQQVTGINFNSGVDSDFAYYWFVFIKQTIIDRASKATLPIIKKKGIRELPFSCPSVGEQKSIVTKLDALSEYSRTFEAETQDRLDHLTALKSSLLDAAFRGQL